MTKLPSLTGKKVIKALRKAGFEVIRVKGSHYFLRHIFCVMKTGGRRWCLFIPERR